MFIIQELIELDKEVLLDLNDNHSRFWDGFMWTLTKTITWIPVGAALLYVIIRNNKLAKTCAILIAIGLCIAFADQITSSFCKPFFERFRPSRDPEIMHMVHTVNGYKGGMYGFVSSHAANTFAVAMFVSLLIRSWPLAVITFTWATAVSYSRIYLGVHYPGDVFCGAIVGMLIAGMLYCAYYYLFKRKNIDTNRCNLNRYTSGGYQVAHLSVFYLVFLLTYLGAVLAGISQFYL